MGGPTHVFSVHMLVSGRYVHVMGENFENKLPVGKCAEPGGEDSTCFYCSRTKRSIQGDVNAYRCSWRAFHHPHDFRPNFKAEQRIEDLGL